MAEQPIELTGADCRCDRSVPMFELVVVKTGEDANTVSVDAQVRAHIHSADEYDAAWVAIRQALTYLHGTVMAHQWRN